jgi:predicted nucleic acid-binding protein
MNVVADASVLVAELSRTRGRELAYDQRLQLLVTVEQWSETLHELRRRWHLMTVRGWLAADQALLVQNDVQTMIDTNVIEVVPRHIYHDLEAKARRRIPRDPNDWPTVALALTLDAGILTADYDFLGCGCPTWSFETLRAELEASS